MLAVNVSRKLGSTNLSSKLVNSKVSCQLGNANLSRKLCYTHACIKLFNANISSQPGNTNVVIKLINANSIKTTWLQIQFICKPKTAQCKYTVIFTITVLIFSTV